MSAEASESKFRTADFLVIGAMKSGTTTLYYDLLAQPSIFLPDKESNFLIRDVSRGFEKASGDQVCGEVCPDYSKRPEIKGVAEKLPGKDLKVVYLVRDPIERLISHHHFISTLKSPQNPGMPEKIDDAIQQFPELISFGRYAFQLQPWIRAIGIESVLIVKFEDYIEDRSVTLEAICKFIGANFTPEKVAPDEIHNASESRPVLNRFWKGIRENPIYRRLIRPLTSLEIRNRFRQSVLPKSSGRPAPPSPETLEYLKSIFKDDLAQLQQLLGDEKPLWDLKQG